MMEEMIELPPPTLPDDQAQEWAEEHYIDGFPDFSRFDDTAKDEQGNTARDRAIDRYYDRLDRMR